MDHDAPVLLALDAGTRVSGWAAFTGYTLSESGFIRLTGARAGAAEQRIAGLIRAVDDIVERCEPSHVALCQPSGLRWEVPALARLEADLVGWARRRKLPMTSYLAGTVREAVAGNPRASHDAMTFATMTALGLVGVSKSTHEWEAIAVGAYHLWRQECPPT